MRQIAGLRLAIPELFLRDLYRLCGLRSCVISDLFVHYGVADRTEIIDMQDTGGTAVGVMSSGWIGNYTLRLWLGLGVSNQFFHPSAP